MSKYKRYVLITIIGILINLLGRYISYKTNMPAYMDFIGSLGAAYFGGPVCAGIAALISNGISSAFIHTDILIMVADVATAIGIGFMAKKLRFLEKMVASVTVTTVFALDRTFFIWIFNLIFLEGKTTLEYPNALISMFESKNLHYGFNAFFGAWFIGFVDIAAAVIILFIAIRLIRYWKKKKRAKRLKKALGGTIRIGLLAMSLVAPMALPITANADEGLGFVEKTYSSEDGLMGGGANDITQTSDGSMWVGTHGGLYRFTGDEFTLLNIFDNVRSVKTLFTDHSGLLWVGTNESGVTLIDGAREAVTIDVNKGLLSNSVKYIEQDAEGNYYFATAKGLCVAEYDGKNIIVKRTFPQLDSVRHLATDSVGHVVAVDSLGKVWEITEEGEAEEVETPDYIAKSVNYDSNDRLYIGTSQDQIYIYEYEKNSYKLKQTILTEGLNSINELFFDSSGITFIAAESGIGYIDLDGNVYAIDSREFNNSVENIFKDYQGNIWFTSARCGLLSIGKSRFSDLFKSKTIEQAVVNVVREYNNRLYIGTESGLEIIEKEKGGVVENTLTERFAGDRIRSMTKTAAGNLLILGNDEGLVEVRKDGSFSDYLYDAAYRENETRFIMQRKDGTIVTSSNEGLTFMRNHRVLRRLKVGQNLGSERVLNLIETDDGTLLAGTDGGGILQIDGYKVKKYLDIGDGLNSGVILRIVKDNIGGGYFVLTGNGMDYIATDGSVVDINGLDYNNNYDLWQTDDEKVYILGGAGIYIIDYDELMHRSESKSYVLLDSTKGLPGSITSNAWNYLSEDGMFYISGTTGLYSMNIKEYGMEVTEYKTELRSTRFDKTIQYPVDSETTIIDRGVETVELTIGVNNFTMTDPIIRYYMSGVDTKKKTVPASQLKPIEYSGLTYGQHDFHIEVLNEDKRLLSDHVYSFFKERELYETLTFKIYFQIIMVLIFAFAIVSAIQGGVYGLSKRDKQAHEQLIARLEKEKADALERALHSEENANKTKSEFLANMSHEIRTPINAIIGMDTMIMRETSQSEVKQYAKDIHSASQTLLSLINDILDFSKIESGKLELVLGDYDLATLINNLINMVKPKAESKSLELELDINPDIPGQLFGDEVRIQQIILNILNNAVKYTREGKIVFKMDFERFESKDILLKVSISDTGIGIKKEDIDKLFSPYQRIEEKRNKNIEGTGLGMSITKNLLDKMGSKLTVNSVYGEGSTFSFAIIQTVRSEEKLGDFRSKVSNFESADTNVESYHAPDANILIVDDVKMNLMVAKRLLKRIKIGVELASGGVEAVGLAKERKYDIIFLDSMMPEMDGEETLHEIRNSCHINDKTPIIVLTADAIKGAREEYIRKGFDDYLSKPIEGVVFEALIKKYLPEEKIVNAKG